MSLGGLPFWRVSAIHKGPRELTAAGCDFTYEDWPAGKNIRDEVPSTTNMGTNMNVAEPHTVPRSHVQSPCTAPALR